MLVILEKPLRVYPVPRLIYLPFLTFDWMDPSLQHPDIQLSPNSTRTQALTCFFSQPVLVDWVSTSLELTRCQINTYFLCRSLMTKS